MTQWKKLYSFALPARKGTLSQSASIAPFWPTGCAIALDPLIHWVRFLIHWVRCLIHWVRCLIHWVHGFLVRFAPGTGTHWVRGCRGLPCPLGARRGDAAALGSEGAGEGRRPMGRWPGGITETVKIFSKIRNPVGAYNPSLRKKPLCRKLEAL
jgi:hypothetical protein